MLRDPLEFHGLDYNDGPLSEGAGIRPVAIPPGSRRRPPPILLSPFGAGQRVCVGMTFALKEGTLSAAIMAQRFVFNVVPGHPVQPEATPTVRPRNGVRMTGRPRAREVVVAVG